MSSQAWLYIDQRDRKEGTYQIVQEEIIYFYTLNDEVRIR